MKTYISIKKLKIFILIFIILTIIFPIISFANEKQNLKYSTFPNTNLCLSNSFDNTNSCKDSAEIWQKVGIIILALKIVIPLILIILGVIDLCKAFTSNDEKVTKTLVIKLSKRFIAALVIFLMPSIVGAIFNLMVNINIGEDDDYNVCAQCITNAFGDKCTKVIEDNQNYSSHTKPINVTQEEEYFSGEIGKPLGKQLIKQKKGGLFNIKTYFKEGTGNIEDNMYRYGISYQNPYKAVDNYICFGTSDKNECTSTKKDKNGLTGQDKYMYRIIGVTKNGEIKLIKMLPLQVKSLEEKYNDKTHNMTGMFDFLNDRNTYNNKSIFLGTESNPTLYVPNNEWRNMIQEIETKSSGVFADCNGKIEECFPNEKTILDDTNSTDEKVKISLMMPSDACVAGPWICQNMEYNDILWTQFPRISLKCNNLKNLELYNRSYCNESHIYLPTFYLKNDVLYKNGKGTIDEPFMINRKTSLKEIIMTSSTLSEDLQGGLYRYQGKQGEVDNYICFGTDNAKTCTNNQGKYMYRIIGINKNNEVKVIKNTPIGKMKWDDGKNNWANSSLQKNINGKDFLTNKTYVPNDAWQNLIETKHWCYGDLELLLGEIMEESSSEHDYINEKSINEVYNIEVGSGTNSFKDSIYVKIGLMKLHDFYYAAGFDDEDKIDVCIKKNIPNKYIDDKCSNNWLVLNNIIEKPEDNLKNPEWTMISQKLSSEYAINIYSFGDSFAILPEFKKSNHFLQAPYKTYESNVRPVFYLKKDIIYKGGTGNLADPIIIRLEN